MEKTRDEVLPGTHIGCSPVCIQETSKERDRDMLAPVKSTGTKDTLRSELEASRLAFHALLDSLSEADFKKKSLNPGWTNEEILFHIALGFFVLLTLLPLARFFGRFPKSFSHPLAHVLNSCTIPFNWINALGTRLAAHGLRNEMRGGSESALLARSILSLSCWLRRGFPPASSKHNSNEASLKATSLKM